MAGVNVNPLGNSLTNTSVNVLRQQMDDSNHEMVNMLAQQIGTVFNHFIQNTNESYQQLTRQMGRIADAFGVPRTVVANPLGAAVNNAVEINAVPHNEPLQANVEIAALQGGRNQLDNPHVQVPQNIENPILINRNMDADRIVERVRQNNIGGHRNIAGIVELLLNQHGFNVGYANRPHFASAFSEFVLKAELPRGWKVPKFTKFSGATRESTVEHIARYQIEAGDIANNENLKMKYFPSSLTKNAFTWFTTLLPNSIHNWTQLERVFHEQFFRGESKVSLKELASVKRKFKETIDD
ncbi:uncharacterized protein LOC130744220 [Lotus japonicus]|uniref:uncharacterized protein LOC130744220 n=1 Tax=Lotus japonicus TaxID=34305 RepID=UPI002588D8E3|nr:uncharacterized protein LOC130744220 [Lotus japonicus]